ncbi:MAG: glycoside hydrolase family 127 protein, partial [Propionibacteriaceae bacterium]|nr:glycoside hydrolase family 127 protein [Propionibacteriaceae bacterium]
MITSPSAVPVAPRRGTLHPLGLDKVRITGGFWAGRQRVNGAVTIPHALKWETGLGWIGNYAATAAGDEAPRAGREFADSETYKLLEAMTWESARDPAAAPRLEAEIARLVALIAAAQADDGYLNTHWGGPGQPARYTDLEWGHELYCDGHLFQAAAARLRCGHDDELVAVALKAADHVCTVFGPAGRAGICGHPGVEAGLAELGRAAHRPQYVEQARLFLDRRGHGLLREIELGQDYFQDDQPIREATVFRGHAVRAGYLAAGALDVADELGDDELFAAVKRQYDRTLARRTYITGGMGSRHTGEAFGDDFELPPDRAYCETCAAIASVMVAWRLLLATGEERYADTIERTLYNAIACSPSEAGDTFFYANPLQVRYPGHAADPATPSPRAETGIRAPWFTVACCPHNVARTVASLAAYVASVDGEGIRIHQYADSEITAELASGQRVRLRVTTSYPYQGRVNVTILETDTLPWTLALRIPAWADVTLEGLTRQGDLAVTTRVFAPGDTVALEIGLTPRWTHPDPRIDAVRGCVAVERGPLVLCLESTDLPAGTGPAGVTVNVAVPPVAEGDGARIAVTYRRDEDRAWPYGEPGSETGEPGTARLIPYHRWG